VKWDLFPHNKLTKKQSHTVILVPGFAGDEQDENCIPSIQYFVQRLVELNPDKKFSIIAFEYPYIQKSYLWQGIPVYSIGGSGKRGWWKLITWWKVLLCFRKINKMQRVTTIQSFWLRECTFMGVLISKMYKLNFLAILQGQESMKGNFYLSFFKYFNIKVISNSSFNANVYHQSTGKNCLAIIPFGVDYDALYQQVPFSNEPRSIDIVGLGSLLPVKNYKLFIEIIAQLSEKFPQLTVKLIGGGPQFILLQQKIISAGLTNTIELLGFVESRAEALRYVSQAKILLHTSSHEGQCYSFMEAYAYALDIVAFDVGYLPDTSKSHPCKSKEEMIKKLGDLLSKPFENKIEKVITMKESALEFSALIE
jgi:glycosyltransferase involved in cell wall biosynthesis